MISELRNLSLRQRALLALFHAQAGVTDDDYEMRENEKALAWLSGSHRITAPVVALLRAQIAAWPTPPALLAPTHGDWQPRNWIIRDGVSVIDFGRAALRPALTDFARLAAQEFRRESNLETAFLDGYAPDQFGAALRHQPRRARTPRSKAHPHLPGRSRLVGRPGRAGGSTVARSPGWKITHRG